MKVFSNSFYTRVKNQSTNSSVSQRKKKLIEAISEKIYSKYKQLITLAKVKEFTEHILRNKKNIEPSDLSHIEQKLELALQMGFEAQGNSSPSGRDSSQQVQTETNNSRAGFYSNPRGVSPMGYHSR